MRRPVIAMCAALAALATPMLTQAAASAASAAPTAFHPTAATAASDATAARSAEGDTDTPLSITIDQLTPSTIPAQGRIHVSGTVTNNGTATWSTINIYAFVSREPMTTSGQLSSAARTDPAEFVGNRLCADGTCAYYATIPSLAPGEHDTFSFSVPRRLLDVSAPGVYWFGVHALGQGPDGRDDLADGRARTFLPLVPQRLTGRLPTALVIPLRHEITHADDGSLADLAGWMQTLQPGGRLMDLLDFGASAGDQTVDWLVDPALVDAVRQLAAGNPPRSLAANLAAGQNDGEPDGAPDGSATPTPSASSGGSSSGATSTPSSAASSDSSSGGTTPRRGSVDLQALDPATRRVAQVAQTWLDRLSAAIRAGDQVLTLPYGDTDVSAAAERDPKLYQRARARSAASALPGGTLTPAVGSPSGYLSQAGLAMLDPGTVVIATDQMFDRPPPTVAEVAGRPVVVAAHGASAGGPSPGNPLAVFAMRQRLLAEAAVRFLHPQPAPLVVVLPHDWNPPTPGAYFSGLDAPWLDLTTVDDAVSAATARPVDASELRYPTSQTDHEIGQTGFDSANRLIASGDALQSLLTLNNLVSGAVADEALTSTSYSARVHPDASRAGADRSRAWIDQRLGSIHVSAPSAVTLSSSSGRFSTTITNDLDQPVTVGLVARSDDRLRIVGPRRVDIAAHGRYTVLLTARTATNGVHDVDLVLVDKRGVALGATTRVSVRSAQVSKVIWLFLGIGAVLLFGTIGLRLFRRIRQARRSPPPSSGSGDDSRDGGAADPAREPAEAGRR